MSRRKRYFLSCCRSMRKSDILRIVLYVMFVIDTIMSFFIGFSRLYWAVAVMVAVIAVLHIWQRTHDSKNK